MNSGSAFQMTHRVKIPGALSKTQLAFLGDHTIKSWIEDIASVQQFLGTLFFI